MEDFYLNSRGLAGYFEAQWFDKFVEDKQVDAITSESKLVPLSFAKSSHCSQVADFITQAVSKNGKSPHALLEVGAALGRNYYELVQRLDSLKQATLVEPSGMLLNGLKQLLVEEQQVELTYIHGLNTFKTVEVDNRELVQNCAHVDLELINQPLEKDTVSKFYDLVVCLNVLDQCESPLRVINALKQATQIGGVLVVSCTYQWNAKHIKDRAEAVDDIKAYFGEDWRFVSEAEHEYRMRFNERYAMQFLSHVVAYVRTT
ncbi:methyltransferase domain-containing protein [Vibrio parahaemolyticus]|uniref:methyltransferase domain-containing protein n=1 Tax=Vibrio parahaemolyticus TaxID=670 RepID=UPI0010AAACC0|nr:methyltransferase domain-containing protein [Vibrio parahaemolyticus]ELA9310863.1 methyltransferase domain-containing protein [Vibrio parahaemolyticus]MBE4112463.1 methyltransferase domain-containing protein [Vibrio parahaemolyticus]MBE4318983.1 methyltransferase domain-containing protein [Vibrio parahaemolyticus]MBE4337128.1 methyltransferase domain-containing protein [Vibrio parahaemolyticus]THE60034.1 methyltransferase domain-containing protein [Vibrio parahaemolyticus]